MLGIEFCFVNFVVGPTGTTVLLPGPLTTTIQGKLSKVHLFLIISVKRRILFTEKKSFLPYIIPNDFSVSTSIKLEFAITYYYRFCNYVVCIMIFLNRYALL